MKSVQRRIWASKSKEALLSTPPKKRTCPSLLDLCLCSISKPFLPSSRSLTKEDKQKEEEFLSVVLNCIAPKNGLKERLFSEFVRQGCYKGPILSSFSSSNGGFLDSLDLSGTQVSNEGLALVGTIRTLSVLMLQSCTHFDDGGISALARGACTEGLRVLNLSKCKKITDSGLFHLPSFPQLLTLVLSYLMITDEGAIELRSLTKLRHLSLSRTKITDATLKAFSNDFSEPKKQSGLVSLTAIKLNFTNLSSSGVLSLANFPSLEVVDLFGCCLKENAWEEFQQRLEEHRNANVHQTTGKLVIVPPNIEKREIERRNFWKDLECPAQPQWNTRQLAVLLNGSRPTSRTQPPTWKAPPTITPRIPPLKGFSSNIRKFSDSIEDFEVTAKPIQIVPIPPRVPANHPPVLPTKTKLEDKENPPSKEKAKKRRQVKKGRPVTRKRRKSERLRESDEFLSPLFFGEETTSNSEPSSIIDSPREKEHLECAKIRSAERERGKRAQSYQSLKIYCEHTEQTMKKRKVKRG